MDDNAPSIELRPIGDVKPYPGNAKKHPQKQIDAIAASIRAFGFNQPVVVDRESVVIVGHGRLLAAQSLGMEEIPVVMLDIDDGDAAAYRLADNKLNESEWDMEIVIPELKGLTQEQVKLTGFKLDLVLLSQENADEIPTENVPAIAQLGDLFSLGEHRLMCGSSTIPKDVEKLMGGGRAKMVFTDPPWNVAIGKDSNPRHRQRAGLENDDLSSEDFESFLAATATSMSKACEGDVYVVLGASEWPKLDLVLRNAGYHWSATIIWAKDVFVLGRSKYHRRYEPIWYGWHKDGKSSFGDARDQDDVWEIPRPKKSPEHPTMKPVDLCARAIKNSSAEGDIVLDFFGGAGSTLIAADQLKRRCFMMELEPKYCDVIIARWEKLTGQKAVRIVE